MPLFGSTSGRYGGSLGKNLAKPLALPFAQMPENERYWRSKSKGAIGKPPKGIGELLKRKIVEGLKGAGVPDRHAARIGNKAFRALADATPVGNATGAEEGANTFRLGITRGDLGTAALGAAVFGLSAFPLPGTGKAVIKRKLKDMLTDESGAIRAWHGSPHDFDKFDAAKLGQGEGNLAYGRGLYFAESPGVASSYVQPRGAEPMNVPPAVTDHLRGLLKADDYLGFDTFGQAVHAVRSNPLDFHQRWEVSDPDAIRDALNVYDAAKWPQGHRPRLYEVNIDAEPTDFLDYDALGPRAETLARRQARPGVRYLDQNSRMRGQGTRNYVVFDDSLIDILNKF